MRPFARISRSIVSGAITHTPDGVYLSGPAHGPKNYWMHCGASIGICQGGGAGKYLAQWMVHGQAEINMREFDPRRFGNWATKDYTAEVSVADYHHMYYCYKPAEQHEVGRGLRKSSLYDKLKGKGASFCARGGWERAARLIGGGLMIICGVVALHASPLGLLLSGAGVVTLVTGVFNNVDIRSEHRHDELSTEFKQATLDGSFKITRDLVAAER